MNSRVGRLGGHSHDSRNLTFLFRSREATTHRVYLNEVDTPLRPDLIQQINDSFLHNGFLTFLTFPLAGTQLRTKTGCIVPHLSFAHTVVRGCLTQRPALALIAFGSTLMRKHSMGLRVDREAREVPVSAR